MSGIEPHPNSLIKLVKKLMYKMWDSLINEVTVMIAMLQFNERGIAIRKERASVGLLERWLREGDDCVG